MEPWTLVAVVLLAVLTGAALPVLIEAHRTLREARSAIRRLDGVVEPAVRDFHRAIGRVDRIAAEIEPSAEDVGDVLRSVAGLAGPLRDLRDTLVSAAAVAGATLPVLNAALRSFTSDPEPGADREAPAEPDAASERTTAAVEP